MKIVIFDMDGTLVDSAKDITVTVNHIRALHHDLPPLSSREVVEIINRPVRNLPKLFYGTDIYEANDKKLFETHYFNQCIQNPILYPNIEDTLNALKSNGVKLSVATNAPSIFAKRILNSLNAANYFDYIVGPDIAGASKPNPDMLHYILKNYNFEINNHNAWMVGDNQKDMQAAQNAKIKTIFAAWGFESEGEGDMVADSPLRLLDVIL